MFDPKITNEISAFLALESPADSDIIAAAELLLRINRNHALHQVIVRRPQRMLPKLTYELRKHLRYRMDGLTLQQVNQMQQTVMAETQAILDAGEPETDTEESAAEEGGPSPSTDSTTEADGTSTVDTSTSAAGGNINPQPSTLNLPKRGKRADHDQLPDEIKELWDNNAARYKRMKAIFETCKSLEQPCDRYEYLVQLKESYEAYKADMQRYDSYTAPAEGNTEDTADTSTIETSESAEPTHQNSTVNLQTSKSIGNARAYISKNRKKYEELSATDETADQAAELRQKLQERIDTLKACSAAIDPDTLSWLAAHNFDV